MSWRFIPYSIHDGASNMAVDLGLLEAAEDSTPTLRLYGFHPACMTIGQNQKIAPEIVQRVNDRGIDVVRRPTGGRAVLHMNDITYSFVATHKGHGKCGILESSVSAAYKQICAGLQNAFEILGVRTELGSSNSAYRNMADCFLATTNADLHFKGRKLAGSAQLRRRESVLQHGSIPLNLEQSLMSDLLGASPADAKIERHANLFELIARTVSMEEIESAMLKGFAAAFKAEFAVKNLSDNELSKAASSKTEFLVNARGVSLIPEL